MLPTLETLFSPKGRVAVVTGGGGALGGAMARALGGLGARVAVVNRSASTAEAAARDIVQAGGTAIAASADVTDPESVRSAARDIERELGPVDLLVNAAGGNQKNATTSAERFSPATSPEAGAVTFFNLDPAAVSDVMRLNFNGTLIPSQVFAESMAARGRGVIINIASMAGIRPLTKVMGYSAAKAAVENFTRWMAVHLAPAGIRVNAIAPGFFLTEQNRFLLTKPDGGPTPRGESILRATPMARMGEPSELVAALLYLAGDGAGFVTGTTLAVDGGFSAFGGV